MRTQFSGDCPAMELGDEVADTENLSVEDRACDCMTCRDTEQQIHRAKDGGFLDALQMALQR